MSDPMNISGYRGDEVGNGASDIIAENYLKIRRMERTVYFPPDEYAYVEDDANYTPPADDEFDPDAPQNETFDTMTAYWHDTPDKQVWGLGIADRDTDNERFSRLIRPDGKSIALTNFWGDDPT